MFACLMMWESIWCHWTWVNIEKLVIQINFTQILRKIKQIVRFSLILCVIFEYKLLSDIFIYKHRIFGRTFTHCALFISLNNFPLAASRRWKTAVNVEYQMDLCKAYFIHRWNHLNQFVVRFKREQSLLVFRACWFV